MKNEIYDNLINNFINLIKDKFSPIKCEVEYDHEKEGYSIWHNREDLEFDSEEFDNFSNKLFFEELFSKGVPNPSFCYSSIAFPEEIETVRKIEYETEVKDIDFNIANLDLEILNKCLKYFCCENNKMKEKIHDENYIIDNYIIDNNTTINNYQYQSNIRNNYRYNN